MIRFPFEISIQNLELSLLPPPCLGPKTLCYTSHSAKLTDMKRLLPLMALAVALFSVRLDAATVTGTVGFVTKRGQRPVVDETLVWLEPVSGVRPVRREPEFVQMKTSNKTLIPHILAIPVGSTVAFPNEDPISHNLFSLSGGNSFDLGLYRRGPGKREKFDTPGIINVYCNVHPNMSAVIHVMSTPYYGLADGNGRYVLDVPRGRYRLVAWNEQGGTSETTIDVGAAGVAVAALTIDSRNFRGSAHTNKLGKPYQAGIREY